MFIYSAFVKRDAKTSHHHRHSPMRPVTIEDVDEIQEFLKGVGVPFSPDLDDFHNFAGDQWLDSRFMLCFLRTFKNVAGGSVMGLQDTLSSNMQGFERFDLEKRSMQPANISNAHWFLLTDYNVPPSLRGTQVTVCDSFLKFSVTGRKGRPVVNMEIQVQAAMVLADKTCLPEKETITLDFISVEQQKNADDCGYHVASACCLLWNQIPLSDNVLTVNVRQAFIDFLRTRDPSRFSVRPKGKDKGGDAAMFSEPLKVGIEVTCHCRMPLKATSTLKCLECDNDFHSVCYMLSPDVIGKIRGFKTSFLCYLCRKPGIYNFGMKKINFAADGDLLPLKTYIRYLTCREFRYHISHVTRSIMSKNTISDASAAHTCFCLFKKYDITKIMQSNQGYLMTELKKKLEICSLPPIFPSSLTVSETAELLVRIICRFDNIRIEPIYQAAPEPTPISDDDD